MDEQFPRQAWRLLPSYRPREITLTDVTRSYCGTYYTIAGSSQINATDTWDTKAEAIAAGHKRLDEQQAKLDKQAARIKKRRAELIKAAD